MTPPETQTLPHTPAAADTTITVLVENTVSGRGLMAEHGLSFLVQSHGHRVLFDTGQTGLLARNAEELQVPIERVAAIALSHGHYDHTGGLAAARGRSPRARIFAHPALTETKYAGNPDGSCRLVGLPDSSRRVLTEAPELVVWTREPTEIVTGLWLTGPIPRVTDFEDTGGRFFLDANGARPDPLWDDQALFFDSQEGLVVLLGCAHAGLVNTLRYVRQLSPGRPLCAVLGGFHLLQATPRRMAATIEHLRELSPAQLRPAHCTGWRAVTQLASAFPTGCESLSVGHSMLYRRAGH